MITSANYDRLMSDTPLELSDGSFIQIPPHPSLGLLDDDQLEAWEDLQFEMKSYDSEDIYLEAEVDADGNEISPATVLRDQLVKPYRKDGVLVKPAHSIRVVIAAIGEDAYARLRAGGKGSSDVWKIWGKKNVELQAAQD